MAALLFVVHSLIFLFFFEHQGMWYTWGCPKGIHVWWARRAAAAVVGTGTRLHMITALYGACHVPGGTGNSASMAATALG